MKSKLLLGAVLLTTIMMIPACSNTHVNPSNVVSSQSEVLGVSIESVDNVRVVDQGSQLSLTAKVYPETKSQEVIWSSSNETIATVKSDISPMNDLAIEYALISYALPLHKRFPLVASPISLTDKNVNDEVSAYLKHRKELICGGKIR